LNGRDENFNYITRFLFATLTEIDIESEKEYPQLAAKLPQIIMRKDGLLNINFEIRKEAKWDNGTPVTADDVELVIKTGLIPQVHCDARRQGFIDVKDFIKDSLNNKKFTIVSAPYFAAASTWNGLNIFPKYIYDADNLLINYSVKQLSENLSKNIQDEKLIQYANQFNSEIFSRKTVVGCGPYTLKEWKTGEKIIIEKKKNWWGEKTGMKYSYFNNYPENITWQIIRDNITALTTFKSQ
jgi:peptide/nickel transport system substrate-binding protein